MCEKPEPLTLTIVQAAELMGVPARVIRDLIAKEQLKTMPMQPPVRIARAEIMRFVSLGVTQDSTDKD